MPKIRVTQAPKPTESGLPVLWYYFVTVLVVACLVIIFAVVALSKYREVILNAATAQGRSQLESAGRLTAGTVKDAKDEASLLRDYLEREASRAAPGEARQSPFWEEHLRDGSSLLLPEYSAPANTFVVLTDGPGQPGELYVSAEIIAVPPDSSAPASTDAAPKPHPPWNARSGDPAAFWAGPFGALAREVFTKGVQRQSSLYLAAGESPHALITSILPLRQEGKIVGLVGVSSDVEPLLRTVEGWRVGDRGGLLLLENASSTVLTRPVQGLNRISGFLAINQRFSYNLAQNPRYGIGQTILASTLSAGKVQGDDGQGYYVLSQPVEPLAWSVIAYIPEEEIIAEFALRSRSLVALSLGLLVAVVAAIVVLNRVLSFPISRLLQAVGRPIPRVDVESISRLRAPEDGPREIATLAEAFNRLLDTIVEEMQSKAEYAKRLESSHEHLSGFSKMLEKMVGDRTRELERSKETAELARENAERAQKYAEEANEAKSNFLANISHELRTPMNAILGYTELIMEEAEETESTAALPDLQKVHTAGKHLLTLIDDILDISKIEAGRVNLKFTTFHVGDMLEEVIQATEPLTRMNDNQLYFATGVGDVQMTADRTKVKQILLNLAGNACKFTDHGEIHLEAVCTVEQGRPYLVCEVRDTGMGMSAGQLARIFEKFSQVDESSTRRHGGTGLGLYICKNYSEMMGGSIGVVSEPGAGSSFTLDIPLDVPGAITDRDKAAILAMERLIKEKSGPVLQG